VDARTFLGMEPDGDDLHWRMHVTPQLTTPGNFLFGGCALGAALVALEKASGRPTVWATGHYLSYALTDAELLWDVTLAAVGGHVTQGRAVGSVDGREILTVNAALGQDELAVGWRVGGAARCPPSRPVPPRYLPEMFRNTIMDSVEVRSAKGRTFEEMDGFSREPGLRVVGAGARPPDSFRRHARHLRRLRLRGRLPTPRPPRHGTEPRQHAPHGPTEADGVGALRHPHARPRRRVRPGHRLPVVEDGDLLATASQSFVVRPWPEYGAGQG
jgi:hypothetical protein